MEPKSPDRFLQIRVEISIEIGAGETTCYTFSCGPLTCYKFESENHSHLVMRGFRIWKYKSLALAFENHSHYQTVGHPPHLVLQYQGFRLSFLLVCIVANWTAKATP